MRDFAGILCKGSWHQEGFLDLPRDLSVSDFPGGITGVEIVSLRMRG